MPAKKKTSTRQGDLFAAAPPRRKRASSASSKPASSRSSKAAKPRKSPKVHTVDAHKRKKRGGASKRKTVTVKSYRRPR